MFGGNVYVIRPARDEDADALAALAELEGKRPLGGRVLIGELAGRPAAALSLADGRTVADPSRATSHLVVQLRMRAAGLQAHERTPSVGERVRAVIGVRPAHAPAQA